MKYSTISHLAILAAVAFDPGSPGWKVDDDGKLELKDGNPIYVDASGRETVVASDTITSLNAEARQHREAAGKAIEKLKNYEVDGKLIDPELARKAMDTVKNIDAKKLIDAGEVEKVREAVKAEFTAQLSEKDKALAERDGKIENMEIGGIFKGSTFLREKVALPLDMVESYFKSNFKLDNGKPTAYYKDGNPVMSKEPGNIGNPATPDEALRLLIEAHPQKDMLLKADDANGTGNNGAGGGRGGGRSIKRAEFEKMAPQAQAEIATKQRAGEIAIVD